MAGVATWARRSSLQARTSTSLSRSARPRKSGCPPPPPDFHPSYDPHVTAREVVAGARYPVTLYQVVAPQVNSDARPPDGTWLSSVRTESFVVDGVTPDFKHPYTHSPPFSAAVILEGKRATPELARKILKTVVFL